MSPVVVPDEGIGAGVGCVLEGAVDGADGGGTGAVGTWEMLLYVVVSLSNTSIGSGLGLTVVQVGVCSVEGEMLCCCFAAFDG